MPTPIEDEFIPWGREAQQLPPDSRGHLAFTACAGSRLHAFERVGLVTEHWVTSPRGADLLATADAIGYDPTSKPEPAPKPATRECPGCKGKGRQSIPAMSGFVGTDPDNEVSWDMTCGTCKGACVVPALRVVLGFDSSIEEFMTAIEAQAARWAAVGVPPRVLDSTRNIVPLDGVAGTSASVKATLDYIQKRVAETTGIPRHIFNPPSLGGLDTTAAPDCHENVASADVESRRRELASAGWTIVDDKRDDMLTLTRRTVGPDGCTMFDRYYGTGHRLTYRRTPK